MKRADVRPRTFGVIAHHPVLYGVIGVEVAHLFVNELDTDRYRDDTPMSLSANG
jgi:hypothetical protein